MLDLNRHLSEQTIVFFFDNFELVGTLGTWIRDSLISQLGEQALVVLATQDQLSSDWDAWLPLMQSLELTRLPDNDVSEYVKRVGIIDPIQLQTIVQLSQGYPLAIVIVSEHMRFINNRVSKIETRGEALAVKELASHLRGSLHPDAAAILSGAAVFRWFTIDTLQALFTAIQASTLYHALKALPYVQPVHNGLSLPPEIRQHLCDELKVNQPLRYNELNAKAAQFYERQIQSVSNYSWLVNAIEYVFHSFEVGETQGTEAFSKMFRQAELTRNYELCQKLLQESFNRQPSLTNLWVIQVAQLKLQIAWGQFEEALKTGRVLLLEIGENQELSGTLLSSLGEATYELNLWDNAQEYLLKAVGRLRDSSQTYDLGRTLIFLGNILRQQGSYSKALDCFEHAHDIFSRLEDNFRLAQIDQQIGILHYSQSKLKLALSYTENSSRLYKQVDDPYGYNWNKLLAGAILLLLGHFQKSFTVVNDAFNKFKDLNDLRGQAKAQLDIGSAHYFMCNYDDGLEYYQRGLAACEKQGMTDQMGWGNHGLAEIYLRQARYSEALQCLEISLHVHKKQNVQSGIAHTEHAFAEAYTLQWQFDKANQHLEHSCKVFTSLNDMSGLALVHKEKGAIALRQGNFSEAITEQQKSISYFRSATIFHGIASGLLLLAEAMILDGATRDKLGVFFAEVTSILTQYEFPDLAAHHKIVYALAYLSDGQIDMTKQYIFEGLNLASNINHYVFERVVERLEIALSLWNYHLPPLDLEKIIKQISISNPNSTS